MIGDVILNVLHSVTSLCRNHEVIWSLRYDHIWLLTQPPPHIMPRTSTTDNALKNTKKFEAKKALIHRSPFYRKPLIYYLCDGWPLLAFLALCDLPRKEKTFRKFFENNFRETFFAILSF